MKKLLERFEIIALTHVNNSTLRNWTEKGVIRSQCGGGRGVPHKFTIPALLGVHYCTMYSELHSSRMLLTQLGNFFCGYTESQLRTELDIGNKFLVSDPIGRFRLVKLEHEKCLETWKINVKAELEGLEAKYKDLFVATTA